MTAAGLGMGLPTITCRVGVHILYMRVNECSIGEVYCNCAGVLRMLAEQ